MGQVETPLETPKKSVFLNRNKNKSIIRNVGDSKRRRFK